MAVQSFDEWWSATGHAPFVGRDFNESRAAARPSYEAFAREQRVAQSRMNGYIDALEGERVAAQQAVQKRFEQVQELHDRIIKNAQQFGAEQTERLEGVKQRDVASGAQALVNAGLSNTVSVSALGRRFEENVGDVARKGIAESQTRQVSSALGAKAQSLVDVEEEVPSFELISNLVSQASS